MPNDMMIEAEELAKRYGETQALAGVDFSVPGGSILGLLGPERCGEDDRGADPDDPGCCPMPAGRRWRGSMSSSTRQKYGATSGWRRRTPPWTGCSPDGRTWSWSES